MCRKRKTRQSKKKKEWQNQRIKEITRRRAGEKRKYGIERQEKLCRPKRKKKGGGKEKKIGMRSRIGDEA